jgi:hypothetical protein
MDAASAHEFFAASAGVAGALIGLLFVAISVAPERVLGPEAHEVHAVRAAATLTAFTNALAVALFGLIPTFHEGGPATAVAALGLLFVLSALIRVEPARRAGTVKVRELHFLASLLVVFVVQLIAGIHLDNHPNNSASLQTICVLVIVCFLVGIERAWELVGGPDIGLFNSLARRRAAIDAENADGGERDEA